MYESGMDEEGPNGDGTRGIRSAEEKISYFDIQTEDLPLSKKCQLIPTKVAAPVIVAWFENYITKAFENKQIFL